MTRVALVHAVVRTGGASTRLRWWRDVLAAGGIDAVEVPLLPPGERLLPRGIGRLGAVATGTAAPETLVWSDRDLRRQLGRVRPDAVVAVTLRAFRPGAVPEGTPVVIDYVDRLSESYRQRAAIDGRPLHGATWRVLAAAMARAERAARDGAYATVAAGRADAGALAASWLPITLPLAEIDGPAPAEVTGSRWDAVFTGTLDYGPNVAAVRALARDIWPEVLRLRPRSTLCVAGRRATPEIRRLVASIDAELVEEFGDFRALAGRASVAVAPLPLATGMQIKVLTAAAAGLPQVITPAAAAGLAPGFPASVAGVGPDFARAVVALLDDPDAAARLGDRARAEVRRRYATEQWADAAGALFSTEGDDRPLPATPA